jgi:PhnB protein
MSPVKPIPDGYQRVSPYLCVDGAANAIEFYKQVFDANERMRMADPAGRIGHAELQIGDSVVMLSDPYPEMNVVDPKKLGGSPVTLSVYVTDVDATFKTALDNGATQTERPENKFYGDRSGQFTDPWGHKWSVATHVEDVPPDEMQRRAAAAMSGGA